MRRAWAEPICMYVGLTNVAGLPVSLVGMRHHFFDCSNLAPKVKVPTKSTHTHTHRLGVKGPLHAAHLRIFTCRSAGTRQTAGGTFLCAALEVAGHGTHRIPVSAEKILDGIAQDGHELRGVAALQHSLIPAHIVR